MNYFQKAAQVVCINNRKAALPSDYSLFVDALMIVVESSNEVCGLFN